MSRRFLIGLYEDEGKLLAAVTGARAAGWLVHDVYSPYPIVGVDEAMGLKHSRLGWVAFVAGMGGVLGMLGTELYVAVIAWPVNIGGRPLASLPAFFPPMFEAGVLCAALATVAALFFVSKLYPGQDVEIEIPDVNDHRFAVALDAEQAPQAAAKIEALLKASGALEVLDKQGRAQ